MIGLSALFGELDFQFRNVVLSAPFPWCKFSQDNLRLGDKDRNRARNELARDGVTLLEGFLGASQLQNLQKSGREVFDGKHEGIELRHSPITGHFLDQVREPLLVGPEIAAVAFDPDILWLTSKHLGRPAILSDCDMVRAHPIDMDTLRENNPDIDALRSNTCWHYDVRGRQVKALLYLTDVAEGDQNFAICPGTQNGFRTSRMKTSRFSDEWIANNTSEQREIFGAAGTVAIFDTRCIHRIRRKPGRTRESITFYYHAGFLQGGPRKIRREDIKEDFSEVQMQFLEVI